MKRILTGRVVKKSGDKTVAVLVVTKRQHPKYAKTVSISKKYLAHDPKNAAQVGSLVNIRETRPISARKRWTVVYDS
jgi:small subunit ribosomal protein S17